jgi:Predicted Zn-dependent hydrolases of the beta-lactamase fold
MRKGLVPEFKKAGLDPAKVVANGGAGMNFGGTSKHGAMAAHLVPAVHSNLLGFPSAGFMLDIGGMRVYLSGDTDLYGDMKMLGERYRPNLACVCVGDGPYTMGPEDAARACQWMGVSQAIPVHTRTTRRSRASRRATTSRARSRRSPRASVPPS